MIFTRFALGDHFGELAALEAVIAAVYLAQMIRAGMSVARYLG